jgi:hypothetical protein
MDFIGDHNLKGMLDDATMLARHPDKSLVLGGGELEDDLAPKRLLDLLRLLLGNSVPSLKQLFRLCAGVLLQPL